MDRSNSQHEVLALRELQKLISKISDAELTPQEQQRLEELVCSSDACRDFYITAMCVEAGLPLYSSQSGADVTLFSLLEQFDDEDVVRTLTCSPASLAPPACTEDSPTCIPCVSDLANHASDAASPAADPSAPGRLVDRWRSFRRPRKGTLAGIGRFPRKFVLVAIPLLLTFSMVMASETIRTMIFEVLLPSRMTVADDQGGLIPSGGTKPLLRGPNSDTGTRRIGSSTFEGLALANIMAFRLPALDENDRVHAARLEWTYKRKDGDPQFTVDLYGLGYVKKGQYRGRGFWEGAIDRARRTDYGMRSRQGRSVELIRSGVMTPETEPGRVRIENQKLNYFLQSLYDDGAEAGDLVVFRLNADVSTLHIPRATGYSVVHPPAIDGLTEPADFPMLWVTAKRTVRSDDLALAHGSFSAQSTTAHVSSGSMASNSRNIEPGRNPEGLRRIGSSTSENRGLAGVLLFTLPPLDELGSVEYASLEWTLKRVDGSPDFAVDLYGLGYAPSGKYRCPCFWEGGVDSRTSSDYGLRGGESSRVTLVERGVMRPGSRPGRVVVNGKPLAEYLRSLYESGAQSGDMVVFRLNADRSTLRGPRKTGYSIVLPPAMKSFSRPSEVPVLCISGGDDKKTRPVAAPSTL